MRGADDGAELLRHRRLGDAGGCRDGRLGLVVDEPSFEQRLLLRLELCDEVGDLPGPPSIDGGSPSSTANSSRSGFSSIISSRLTVSMADRVSLMAERAPP